MNTDTPEQVEHAEHQDDVEAHATRVRVALPQEPAGDDVEGHGVRVKY